MGGYRMRRTENKICQLGTFAALLLMLLPLSEASQAKELTFAIHPLLPQSQTIKLYTPLVKHLQKVTGNKIRIVTNKNLFAHWSATNREEYDLILDGPQFTDYRIQNKQYTVLAKFPSVVSYTLVANSELMIMDPEELIGKKIATTSSPSIGALRLFEIFDNPMKQPTIITTDDAITAVSKLNLGEVDAAMIPTFLVNRYEGLNSVLTTQQVPAPAFSTSSKVASETREKIKQALLTLKDTVQGRNILKIINTPEFVATSADEYKGASRLLKGMWGI